MKNNPVVIGGVTVRPVTIADCPILETAAKNNIFVDEDVINNVKLSPKPGNFHMGLWSPFGDNATSLQANAGHLSNLEEFISFIAHFQEELGNTVLVSREKVNVGPLQYAVVSGVLGFTRVIKLELILGVPRYDFVVVFD